jgi:two-component system NtrC family sensor kinase
MSEAAVSEGSDTRPSKETQARATTVRLLQALAAASLLLPLLFFLFAGWLSYRATQALADERLERSLDVMQEQALKAFQSMNLALDTINDLVANRSEAEILADGAQLHQRLRQILGALPEVQSIWLFGPTGHPQMITREYPAPAAEDFSQLDYFTVPRDGPPGVYIGGIHQSVSGGQPYFTFNQARHDADGKFAGVIEMSLLPSDFSRFYSQLASSAGLDFALVRDDGTVLARFPPVAGELRLDERSGFRHVIAANPAGGFYTTVWRSDSLERRVGFRRVPGFSVYVVASIETAQIRNEWLGDMTSYLVFGVPATGLLFGALIVVLQRTRRLYAEQDRREAAEAAMRQTLKLDAIGHLTGGVAHDFNNLLTIIIGNLETAQRQLESWTDGAQIKLGRRIDNAMQGATRAATLTKRLLAFSRQQPLNPSALDINRLLNGLSDFLRRALGEQISLEIVGSGGVWPVEVDAVELETAILNLAVNARDAMPDGGKLTIETSNSYLEDTYCRQHPDVQPGQYVQVAVTDSGAGMTKEVIARAFEPFFTTKQLGQGTGLGLSQVYGFVKQSGGHVKIYSEVGEGTTVKIYLRRFVGKYAPQKETKREIHRGRSGECILVVEDDADVRAYVVDALGTLGYDVLEAAGGNQALRLLDEHKTISLLLTDVVMPGMNGRKLADEAKQRQPELKVVFMTGYSRNAIVHQGRLDPGVALIQKPLTSEHLAATIRKVLDG